MAALSEIESPVWTLSLDGGGAIVEGMDAIRQCIDIIVRTTKGSDPLRPEFGCDVYKYVDKPVNVAIPNMKASILEAIGLWEPRISLSSVKSSLKTAGNVEFFLTYTLADKSLSDSVSFLINNGGISTGVSKQRLVLQGYFPPNPAGYQYQVLCALDGEDLMPVPPPGGFATLDDLYAWVQENWLNYGQWYLTGNALVGYMFPQYGTGSLSISLIAAKRFLGAVPGLPIGYQYSVNIAVDGTGYSTSGLLSPDDVMSWVISDDILGALGDWSFVTSDGSFSDDFGEDFDLYAQFLQVLTASAKDVEINISTVLI